MIAQFHLSVTIVGRGFVSIDYYLVVSTMDSLYFLCVPVIGSLNGNGETLTVALLVGRVVLVIINLLNSVSAPQVN